MIGLEILRGSLNPNLDLRCGFSLLESLYVGRAYSESREALDVLRKLPLDLPMLWLATAPYLRT